MQAAQDSRFSIVIPAYNAEKTLERLADSIAAQTYPAWEVIIVDDCSTDRTGEIADRVVTEENAGSTPDRNDGSGQSTVTKWRVIHKAVNEGVSAARNSGLMAAEGDWLLFWDADDVVEPDLLERVAAPIQGNSGLDIVVYSLYEDFYDRGGQLTYSQIHQIPDQVQGVSGETGEQARESGQAKDSSQSSEQEGSRLDARASLVQSLEKETLYGYPWNKAYRRAFLQKQKMWFPKIPFIEDILFNIQCFDHADGIAVLNQPLYHYINQESDRLTGKYLPDYFRLQKQRYTEFLKQQARWLCKGKDSDLQRLRESRTGRSALTLISGRYFRSFASMVSRELSHGTRKAEIVTMIREEMREGELYPLLRENLPDLGLSGRFLYAPLRDGRVQKSIRHASILNHVRRCFPGLYNRMKQNR